MSNADLAGTRPYTVQLPPAGDAQYDQDAEWCVLERAGESRRLRFHDYHEIYPVPGLYEHLFYEVLQCTSPTVVRQQLARVLDDSGSRPEELVVLDVGAGNGMVGEQLVDLGARTVVGVDIIPEAAEAAERDRPGVYEDYRVLDLTAVPANDDAYLSSVGFNAMTSVAALGFGDIPPAAFATAYNYVKPDGLVAFTIKENFVSEQDPSGFSALIQRMFDENIVGTPLVEHRYQHRLAVSGTPLYYLVYVVEKYANVPREWVTTSPRH